MITLIKYLIISVLLTSGHYGKKHQKDIPDFTYDKVKSDFCEGFYYGYKIGYCFNRRTDCKVGVIPACPQRKTGEKNTYQDGYNRGFSYGVAARKSKEENAEL